MPLSYVALVPVKPPGRGKTRLADLPRDELAAAFALDTVTACLAAPSVVRVLVVTDDARFAAAMTGRGCAALPDGVSGDLNASLSLAAAEAARRWPELLPFAICADLPSLKEGDLEEALTQRPGTHRYVADASGGGTTLYTAPLEQFTPRFGEDSARRHRAAGASPVEGELAGLRLDVDDAEDLAAAAVLGVGPNTARVLDRLATRPEPQRP
jgi:2-phospho-L-lactate guanylyltransferase